MQSAKSCLHNPPGQDTTLPKRGQNSLDQEEPTNVFRTTGGLLPVQCRADGCSV